MRRARDGVGRRSRARAAFEAAEELRQSAQVQEQGGVEETGEKPDRRLLEAVPGEPGRDDGVVMRPNRSIVVGHRVVADLPGGERPNPPAAMKILPLEAPRQALRPRPIGDTGPEAMPRVGGEHPARALLAVERKRIAFKLVTPKHLLESLLDGFCLVSQPIRKLAHPEGGGEGRPLPASGVHVALHLAKRDWARGKRAVFVEDRVAGILPSLIDEAHRRMAEVLDQAVAIAVPVPLHPGERELDVRPNAANQVQVPGAPRVGACEHDEERRRVHASVVAAEGNLSQRGHLAAAHLVNDLSGLRVEIEVLLLRLGLRQEAENALRQPGVHPENLQRGDDSVPPEGRAEPGNASVGIGPAPRLGQHHVQIGARAVQPIVELLVGRGHDTPIRLVLFERVQRGAPGRLEAERFLGNAPHLAGETNDVGRCFAGPERDVEFELGFRSSRWRGLARNAGPTHDAVQPLVREGHAGLLDDRRELPAGGVAPRASDLENVGEVDVPAAPEGHVDRLEPVVRYPYALVADPIPQELLPRDVDGAARNRELPVGADVGVGQIHRQDRVVVAHPRIEQEQTVLVQQQPETRQKARALVVETQLPHPDRRHVAEAVENGECVAVFQYPRTVIDARRGRENVELVFESDDVHDPDHHIAFRIPFPEPPVLLTIQRLWVQPRSTWQNECAGRSPGWPAAKLWEPRSQIRPLPMILRVQPEATWETRRS